MHYFERFKQRTLRDGDTSKDIEVARGIRNFDYMLANKTAPTVHEVIMSLNDEKSDIMEQKKIMCEISNVTNNDQAKYDEKYVKFSMSENITYGSYVRWREAEWLILFEENNSFEIYQTFVMRRCNNVFNFMHDGVLYHIPQVVKNLTLYSDGLDDRVYISTPDAQRQIMMADNELTAKIKVGTRVMLTNSSVYSVTHIDDFSHPGVRTMICRQTTLISLDDLENNIAYNEDSEPEKEPTLDVEIIGDENIYLCDFITYTLNNANGDYVWKLSNNLATITYQDGKSCDVECSDDIKNVNKTFDLEIYQNDNKIANKTITIRGMN